MKHKIVMSVVAAAFLHGCAANPADCDPSKRTGFISTAGCIGSYGQRQQDLADQIENEKSLNASLKDMLASIDAEKATVAGQRWSREAKLANLNHSWGTLKASLQAKAQTNADLSGRIDTLQNKMDSVNAAQDMAPAEKQQRLDSLRRQVNLLMTEMEAGFY
ncbi:MAG: hypothetical protein KDI63_14935 [Gammaproteobacteria bacterium]|nr:hypothetical protein [Gammaproteobacteria bacterium]